MNHAQKRTLIAVAAVTLLTTACAKKKVAAAPPPPPAPGRCARDYSEPGFYGARACHCRNASRHPATPAPNYPNAVTRARIDQLLAKIEDAYFDYDKSSIRPDAHASPAGRLD